MASADYIDDCDDEDHRDRDGFHAPRGELEEFSEVISESHRERRNRTRTNDKKQCPTKKKSRKGAKAVANIDIQPASLGLHGAQFSVSEGAEKRKKAASQPDCQR